MSMISARIERLPFARFHTHLLLMGGLGYMFDAMDAAVLAFILPVLRTAWNLSSVQIGVLGSSTYIGFLFGALLTAGCVIRSALAARVTLPSVIRASKTFSRLRSSDRNDRTFTVVMYGITIINYDDNISLSMVPPRSCGGRAAGQRGLTCR